MSDSKTTTKKSEGDGKASVSPAAIATTARQIAFGTMNTFGLLPFCFPLDFVPTDEWWFEPKRDEQGNLKRGKNGKQIPKNKPKGRYFGAPRNNGKRPRAHAGCDLIPLNQQAAVLPNVYAIAEGKVVRARFQFTGFPGDGYRYTEAVLIEHTIWGQEYLVCYAELADIVVCQGEIAEKGAIIGRIGACKMLHIEFYHGFQTPTRVDDVKESETSRSDLPDGGRPFFRRRGIFDGNELLTVLKDYLPPVKPFPDKKECKPQKDRSRSGGGRSGKASSSVKAGGGATANANVGSNGSSSISRDDALGHQGGKTVSAQAVAGEQTSASTPAMSEPARTAVLIEGTVVDDPGLVERLEGLMNSPKPVIADIWEKFFSSGEVAEDDPKAARARRQPAAAEEVPKDPPPQEPGDASEP